MSQIADRFFFTLQTNPSINSPQKAEEQLKTKNIYLSDWGKDILEKTQFSQEAKQYDLVRLSVAQLGFTITATIQEIYNKAQQLGLELCPAEVGPQLRLQYNSKDLMFIAMNQILDRYGYQLVFDLDFRAGRLELGGYGASPGSRWGSHSVFVFVASKT